MQTYLHLLSPAMHSSVAAKREHHLQEAARLDTEIDLLTLEGRAFVKAKNPQFAARGRLYLEKANAKREVLRAHLIAATDLTDYAEPEPSADNVRTTTVSLSFLNELEQPEKLKTINDLELVSPSGIEPETL